MENASKAYLTYSVRTELFNIMVNPNKSHKTSSVQIRSFFWSVYSCIRTEHRKKRTRKNSVFGHFSRSGYSTKDFYQKNADIREVKAFLV